MRITKEVFNQQRSPRFGTANPERMRIEFWEWMIKGDETASPGPGEDEELAGTGLVIEEGKIKSALGPYRARQLFGESHACGDGPIWTFDRMGATRTELPDGRIVCIAGEHEDFYDPDFFIYNDVIVFGHKGEIEIYGYPKDVFPPTDFHTATLVGGQLIIIGSNGYQGERILGKTPVYSLDLSSYRICEMKTSGEMPGWISRHKAELGLEGDIIVRGGRFFEGDQNKQRYLRNVEDYALDLRAASWRRLTNRNWRQFFVCQEDGHWFAVTPQLLSVEDLVPSSARRAADQPEGYRAARILVHDVPVLLEIGLDSVEVIVEGSLPDETYARLSEAIRANAETFLKRPCVLRK
jgi:hypothetical protein